MLPRTRLQKDASQNIDEHGVEILQRKRNFAALQSGAASEERSLSKSATRLHSLVKPSAVQHALYDKDKGGFFLQLSQMLVPLGSRLLRSDGEAQHAGRISLKQAGKNDNYAYDQYGRPSTQLACAAREFATALSTVIQHVHAYLWSWFETLDAL